MYKKDAGTREDCTGFGLNYCIIFLNDGRRGKGEGGSGERKTSVVCGSHAIRHPDVK